jgi:hypothetical protein
MGLKYFCHQGADGNIREFEKEVGNNEPVNKIGQRRNLPLCPVH